MRGATVLAVVAGVALLACDLPEVSAPSSSVEWLSPNTARIDEGQTTVHLGSPPDPGSNRPAVIFNGRRVSYAELTKLIDGLDPSEVHMEGVKYQDAKERGLLRQDEEQPGVIVVTTESTESRNDLQHEPRS